MMSRDRQVKLVLLCLAGLLAVSACVPGHRFPHNRIPIVIDASRMVNKSLPGDLDARFLPQRPLQVNTQTSAEEGFFKQTHVIAGAVGTHMDTPSHSCGSRFRVCPTPAPYRTIEKVTPEELVGPLCVINIRAQVAADVDYMIQVEDLTRYVARHGPIPDRAWVAMDSGWSRFAYNEVEYKNIGADGKNHHPGWSGAAIQWLLDNTNYTGIAVDTLSSDKGNTVTFEAHATNMGNDKLAVESLDLSDPRIPASGAWIVMSVVKIQGAPEAPVRALILA